MSTIHTTGYFFEVENFSGWNNGTSRFYFWQTVNGNEHIYSFSYNGGAITPNSSYETIVYKAGPSKWYDYDGSSNPVGPLSTVNGITTGNDSSGSVMMKWGHSGYPDPTLSSGGGGSSVPTINDAVGSLSDYSSFQEINVTISSLSPGGSDFVYKVQKDNVLVSDTNTHVNGFETTYSEDYSTLGRFGVWDLIVRQLSTSTTVHLARLTIVDTATPKKVHLNFW